MKTQKRLEIEYLITRVNFSAECNRRFRVAYCRGLYEKIKEELAIELEDREILVNGKPFVVDCRRFSMLKFCIKYPEYKYRT